MEKVKVRFKKLHPEAKIPIHATSHAVGCDFYSLVEGTIMPGETKKFPTGIALELPPEFYMRMEDRSGLALKGIHKVGGIIDSDYRGEICIILHNSGKEPYKIEKHDRIIQGVITPAHQSDFEDVGESELSETVRGEGGFHSTGVK